MFGEINTISESENSIMNMPVIFNHKIKGKWKGE